MDYKHKVAYKPSVPHSSLSQREAGLDTGSGRGQLEGSGWKGCRGWVPVRWSGAGGAGRPSARVHGEELDVTGVPVQGHGRVVHQGPHVGDEELLRLLLLHVLELQLGELLQQEARVGWGKVCVSACKHTAHINTEERGLVKKKKIMEGTKPLEPKENIYRIKR